MYKKLVQYRAFNVFINASLGISIFLSEVFIADSNKNVALAVGVLSIILLSIHTYASQSYSIAKINETDYWKDKLRRYMWLLDSIRILVTRKTEIFRNDGELPDNFRNKSIKLILQMIYEFYKSCDLSETPQMLRIIYQEPEVSSDGNATKYLKVKHWFYSDEKTPHYLNSEREEIKLFEINNDRVSAERPNLPVSAFKSREIEIYENSDSIPYHYEGQEKTVRSLISIPVNGKDGRSVLGIITVSSNRDNFFKNSDKEDHEEYLREFVARVAMELTAQNRG